MVELPRDPSERRKLELLSDLHQQLLSYRGSRGEWKPTDTGAILDTTEALNAYFPDIPQQAPDGKHIIDVIVDDWIEPKARQTLQKLDPHKLATASQAHKLQGVLAYYFTYASEHLSAGQILERKLGSPESICDVWCGITGNKRFIPNKAIESRLVIKSQRTLQRYVAQGMAIVFGISFGAARAGKKLKASAKPEKSRLHSVSSDGGITSPSDESVPQEPAARSDIPRWLNEVNPATLNCDQLDRLISAIGNVHLAMASAAGFNGMAKFALQVPEAVYSESGLFNQFMYDLSRYEPASLEDRVDTIEIRERLRNHPAIQQTLAETERRRLQSTRDADLEDSRRLSCKLIEQGHGGNGNVQEMIGQLCTIATNWLEDAVFSTLIADLFDQLVPAYQVTFASKLLDDCKPSTLLCVASLAARPSAGFVRSRVRYLARSSEGCREHVSSAQARLAQIEDRIHDEKAVDPSTRGEIDFLRSFVSASGLSPVRRDALESVKQFQAQKDERRVEI